MGTSGLMLRRLIALTRTGQIGDNKTSRLYGHQTGPHVDTEGFGWLDIYMCKKGMKAKCTYRNRSSAFHVKSEIKERIFTIRINTMTKLFPLNPEQKKNMARMNMHEIK